MNTVFPFALGSYWASAPAGVLGQTFDSGDGKTWMIVKNSDAAALTAKRVVKWEDLSAFEVDYATANTQGPMAAGVVDPALTTTVPVGAAFYVQRTGPTTMTFGTAATDTAAGSIVVIDDGAAKGEVGGIGATIALASAGDFAVNNFWHYAIGVAHAAVVTGPADVEVMLALRCP